MFKQMRQKMMTKLFAKNPMLHHMLANLFRTHPATAMITAACLLPSRNTLKPSEEILTNKQTFTLSKEYYDELHRLLHIAKAEGHELIRMGNENDGGYIMLDDLPGGIAYSFGIAQNVAWDKDMASRGYDVYMYDHTIDGLPEENARFHWSKLGIADGVSHDERLKTLEELLAMNHHENERDMILKMDVEGAEWGFLESVKPETLARFRHILFEFHGLLDTEQYGLGVKYSRILEMLKKINASHQLLHLHPCNFRNYVSVDGKNFPDTIEATYVIKDKYKFKQDYDVSLPLKIDAPDKKINPEIELGHWNEEINGEGIITSVIRVI